MEDSNAGEDLKRELATARVEGTRYFPAALKERAILYARERWQGGATVSAVARELGVKAGTLMFWQKGKTVTAKAVRPVVIRPSARTYAVLGGRGARVEGLTLDEVAALFGKLA